MGIEDMSARRMIRVEELNCERCLLDLDDERITSMCKVHRRSDHSSGINTFISAKGEHNLKLAVFCMKHMRNIGRSYHPHTFSPGLIISFTQQKKAVESHDRSSITAPMLTDKMMDKERDRAWELLDVYLSLVRADNGIPLAAWPEHLS